MLSLNLYMLYEDYDKWTLWGRGMNSKHVFSGFANFLAEM